MQAAPVMIVIGTPQTAAWAVRQTVVARENDECLAEPVGVVLIGDDRECDLPEPFRVLGGLDDLEIIADRLGIEEALTCVPRAMSVVAGEVRRQLEKLGLRERVLTSVSDVLRGEGEGGSSAEIDPAELLGRESRAVDASLVKKVVKDKRVLITGAGGSIGSELAKICAEHAPSELILMDRSDNALFEIDRQLRTRIPGLQIRAVLHDVVDSEATLRRFTTLHPEVVFHAAAHKHVPLMEDHPGAAIANNLFGTISVADAAMSIGSERFVMISTDKAVNPTSVMGATKRMAELYVRSLASTGSPTRFSLVRFGNVLGSACSVVPIWERQLASGGPLTVTDSRMTRYFMTIPEAAGLVIQSAAIETHEVFVLDMGEPVEILGLAKRFLDRRGFANVVDGYEPNQSDRRTRVRIELTGIRPGEKLYEELAYDAEELTETSVDGVRAWRGEDRPDQARVSQMVGEMATMRRVQEPELVIETLSKWVPIGVESVDSAVSGATIPLKKVGVSGAREDSRVTAA
ncbi:MAG: polysaccharide biosynthesis protein [Planctomycetota bacterium]